MIRRDITARFTGSALGLAWAVLQPLSLVILYWFIFTFMIPGGRLGLGSGNQDVPYIHFLIAGLLPWLGFHEGLMRSTTSIVENSGIVRRLPLRSDLLVAVPNASALIFQAIGLGLFLVALVATRGSLRLLWVLPLALVLQFLLQLGLGYMLAASYVFFRDLTQILGFALSILFYLSPILYSVTGRFEEYFFWNPLTPLLGLFRSALLGSPLPDAASVVFLLIVVAASLGAGLYGYRRVQPTLVDLI